MNRLLLKLKHYQWPFWLGLVAVLLYAGWHNATVTDMLNLTVDETTHLMWLRLIEAGYQPYGEIYITYPPVFPIFLAASWAIWPSLTGVCWSLYIYGLLTAVAVALITRKIGPPLAGIAAALFIVEAYGTCNILSEQSSITGSVFAVWLAMVYRDTGRRWILALSAISLGLSLLTKIQSPFIPAVVGFILFNAALQTTPNGSKLIWQNFQWRKFLIDSLIWGMTLLVVLVIFYLPFNLEAAWQQTVGQHISARDALLDEEGYWASSYLRLEEFVGDHLWLILLAALGFVQSFAYKTKDRYTLLVWFVLATAVLLTNRPLRHKHFVVFLPLLAIWGSLAITCTWQGIHRLKNTGWLTRAGALVGLILAIAYVWALIPNITRGLDASQALAPGIPQNKRTEVDYIAKVTAPADCLLTDNMRLAYYSGRLVPPPLAEISSNRFRSGHLTIEDLVAAGTNYDCQIVALDSRIARFTPKFRHWVEANYLGRFYFDDNEFLYVGKARTTPNPNTPRVEQLGNSIEFLGHTQEQNQPPAKDKLTLTLFWKSLDRPDVNYKIFVQLRDSQNTTLTRADHEPFDGAVPTSRWVKGAVIKDVVHLDLPPTLPPGEYRLAVGLYRPDTLERLPVQNDTSGENAIILQPFF